MENRDNQQERYLGWLAGIIDGEGTITFQSYIASNGTLRIVPFICVVNSNETIISKTAEVFDYIGVANHVIRRKPDTDGVKSFKNRRPCHQIRSDGFKATLKILEAVEPYLVGKVKQSELLREFIVSRKENLIERDELGRIHRIHYTDKEIDILCKVKALNQGKSSETIRLDLQKAGKI